MSDRTSCPRVIGVVAARGGSLRFPGKNIAPILGKPLIEYVIEAALGARLLDRVIVSTNDREIARVAMARGSQVVPRPERLAEHDSPIDEAYRHVSAYCEEAERFSPEMIVAMQANLPIRKPGEIDEVVKRLWGAPWATAVATAKRVTERPEWMKILKDEATCEIKPFMDPGDHYRKQELPDLYLLDGAIIAVRGRVLRETAGNRAVHAYLGDRVIVHVHEARYSVEIDEPDDVQLAEYLLKDGGL